MEKMIREPITLDVNHMMSDIVGFQYGIDFGEVESMQEAAVTAQNAVEKNRGTGWLGWMQLPYNQSEIVEHMWCWESAEARLAPLPCIRR